VQPKVVIEDEVIVKVVLFRTVIEQKAHFPGDAYERGGLR
jgi:hypothetical protein